MFSSTVSLTLVVSYLGAAAAAAAIGRDDGHRLQPLPASTSK